MSDGAWRVTALQEAALSGALSWLPDELLKEAAEEVGCSATHALLLFAVSGALSQVGAGWQDCVERAQLALHNATLEGRMVEAASFLAPALKAINYIVGILNFLVSSCLLRAACCHSIWAASADSFGGIGLGFGLLTEAMASAERMLLRMRMLWWHALRLGAVTAGPDSLELRYLESERLRARAMSAKDQWGQAPSASELAVPSGRGLAAARRVAWSQMTAISEVFEDALLTLTPLQRSLETADLPGTGRAPHHSSLSAADAASGAYPSDIAEFYELFDIKLLDKGLLRQLVKSVFHVGDRVADVGALVGHYAAWLNDTGMVVAHAFDGTPGIEGITNGRVRRVELSRFPADFGGEFDWGLVLEVAEHIPRGEMEEAFLANLRLCCREGVVLSWALPGQGGHGHVNERSLDESVEMLAGAGFVVDMNSTAAARAASTVWYIAKTVAVFRRVS